MPSPMSMQLAVFKYLLTQKIKRRNRYPLVLMLEPLFACNLECAGCGKIQFPADILRKRLSPEECWESAEECGAPIVSLAGGEPLVHPQIDKIVSGLIARGKYVYLCSNALLLEKNLHRFRPSDHLMLSIHLDGREKIHDRTVGRAGVHKTAVKAIRKAKAMGFRVMTNTTIFSGESPEEFRKFFDECMALGTDGMMISPGYAYEKAPTQGRFLKNEQTKAWFRETLKDWRKMGWDFNHSPFYLDFLEGKRTYDCTPWGNPLRNVFGWQKPCYLMDDGGHVSSFKELMESTRFEDYGHASGNPKCANCMAHVGFEPSAVAEAFSGFPKFISLVKDIASIKKPRKTPRAKAPAKAKEKTFAGR